MAARRARAGRSGHHHDRRAHAPARRRARRAPRRVPAHPRPGARARRRADRRRAHAQAGDLPGSALRGAGRSGRQSLDVPHLPGNVQLPRQSAARGRAYATWTAGSCTSATTTGRTSSRNASRSTSRTPCRWSTTTAPGASCTKSTGGRHRRRGEGDSGRADRTKGAVEQSIVIESVSCRRRWAALRLCPPSAAFSDHCDEDSYLRKTAL